MLQTIVVTGACGQLATKLLAALQRRYTCVLLDIRSVRADGLEVPGVETVDLNARSLDAWRTHFCGAQAVVHLAYASPARTGSEAYRGERANLDMNRAVFEAARLEGVRRVVMFSSNHATDYYERLFWSGAFDRFGPDIVPLSDNYYGWSKAATEGLGFVYASGGVGRALEVVMLRIGRPREADLASCRDDPAEMARRLATYLSARDLTQLVLRSLEAPDVRNRHGVPFQIFYGISANTRAFWSIANAREVIGYEPEDDSEIRFADDIARYLAPAQRLTGTGSETAS